MKKIFLALLAFLGIFGLASCGDEGNVDSKKITIKYMGWDSGSEKEPTMKRKMIEHFNKSQDEIYIKIVKHTEPYDTHLNTLATNENAMPDVFLVNSVPDAVMNKLALDITEYATADSEWNDIESSLRESITYYDRVYAIPAAQHYMGYIANLDLLEEYNFNRADYYAGEYTHDEFFTAIKKIQYYNTTEQDGVIGVNATGDMINWLPAALDETHSIKHFMWNGEKLDFANEATIEAIKLIQDIANKDSKYTFESLFEEIQQGEEKIDKRTLIFGSGDQNTVFNAGKMAFLQGATFNTYDEDSMNFEYKFIAYPDQKVIVASDYMCISSKCKNPEAAFKVAKFLTYGAEGYEARFAAAEKAVADKTDKTCFLAGLPINTNVELTAKWFNYVDFPGLKETYEKVSNGSIEALVESNKSVPGYYETRFNMMTGYLDDKGNDTKMTDFIWSVCSANISYNDYQGVITPEWITKVNSKITAAHDSIKKITDQTKASLPNA